MSWQNSMLGTQTSEENQRKVRPSVHHQFSMIWQKKKDNFHERIRTLGNTTQRKIP